MLFYHCRDLLNIWCEEKTRLIYFLRIKFKLKNHLQQFQLFKSINHVAFQDGVTRFMKLDYVNEGYEKYPGNRHGKSLKINTVSVVSIKIANVFGMRYTSTYMIHIT